ncbi:general transcription factor 3C polypeptide 5 [Aplysia californica]|uniref:General transcription factor 3C polypeptide 5 n=1 Tax=Aplysia californica TaxID=6500 RepID=A0ABM0JFY7_APLCA|nr:general transcription factor 3C polypeptide 5 [Aplysia californica]
MAASSSSSHDMATGGVTDDGQNDDDMYEREENIGLEEEMGDENGEKQAAAEDGQEKELFDAYEFGGQEEDQEPPDPTIHELSHLDGKYMDGQKVCTARINIERRFVCVDFPAVIRNKDKAIQMMGGKDCIEKILSRSGRLEVNFRPEDPFCKPTVSTNKKCSNLLIKVRRRKATGSTTSSDGFEYMIEVLGIVDLVFFFDKPCDYQFLPVIKTDSGQYQEMLSKMIPTLDVDRSEYLARSCPLFLPPIMFSRREKPCVYALENDPLNPEIDTFPDSLRKKRVHGTHIINFEDDFLPTEPIDVARSNVERYFPSHSCTEGLEALKKIFEDRPIWSKVACQAQLDPSLGRQLKYLLPMVAYYIMTGPWRNLWCKLGFDPRQHKQTKIYQVLDYRIRTPFNRNKILRKRHVDTARSYQMQTNRVSEQETSLEQKEPSISQQQEATRDINRFDPKYMFRPDTLPPYRQMKYQLCDIYEEQVQKKVHENDGKEKECSERDGWCVPDIADVCRDIINRHVERLLDLNT